MTLMPGQNQSNNSAAGTPAPVLGHLAQHLRNQKVYHLIILHRSRMQTLCYNKIPGTVLSASSHQDKSVQQASRVENFGLSFLMKVQNEISSGNKMQRTQADPIVEENMGNTPL